MDPSTRHSVWSVVIGGGVFWLSLYGVNQSQVQRSISCTSVRKAQLALWINFPVMVIISSLSFMIGVVVFAFYADCHPAAFISRTDQILPLFVMDILADYKGVPGVFVACIFSGTLSTISSGLNAISAVSIKDIFLPYCCPRLSDFKTTLLTKLIVLVSGGVSVLLAIMVGNLGGTVLQASLTLHSILNGPMFGLFCLGMFFPWANSTGALAGCIISLVFTSWIVIGALVHKVAKVTLSPIVTSGCVWSNITSNVTTNITANITATMEYSSSDMSTVGPIVGSTESVPAYYRIYTLSYFYYTIIGAVVVVVVGLIFSLITGHTKPSSLDPRLICPLFDILFPWLPERILKPLRFGIEHEGKYKKYEHRMAELEAALTNEVKVNVEDSATFMDIQPTSSVHALTGVNGDSMEADPEGLGETETSLGEQEDTSKVQLCPDV